MAKTGRKATMDHDNVVYMQKHAIYFVAIIDTPRAIHANAFLVVSN